MLVRCILFCLLSLFISGIPLAQAALPMIADVILPQERKAQLGALALGGDVAAVSELAGRLTMSNNYGDGLFWGMIAQQNGCKGCTYGLIICLEQSPDPKQRRRARFWIRNYDKFRSPDDPQRTEASRKSDIDDMLHSVDIYDRHSGSEHDYIAKLYRNWDFPEYPPDAKTSKAADSAVDMGKLQLDAVDGDPDAALRLARYYRNRSTYDGVILWGSIAAENGSKAGVLVLADTLAHSPHPQQRQRARFWLQQMIDSKNSYSEQEKSKAKQLLTALSLPTPLPSWPYPKRWPNWPTY